MVRKERVVIYGVLALDGVETMDVEIFNGLLRERIGRLVRRTKCFAKLEKRLVCAVGLFQFYWTFIDEFKRGLSPVKMEGGLN